MQNREELLDLILSPIVCDPVRFLVGLQNGLTYEEIKEKSGRMIFNVEPISGSEITLTLKYISEYGLSPDLCRVISSVSPRWKYIMDNYVTLKNVFEGFDIRRRKDEERKYLSIEQYSYEADRKLLAFCM